MNAILTFHISFATGTGSFKNDKPISAEPDSVIRIVYVVAEIDDKDQTKESVSARYRHLLGPQDIRLRLLDDLFRRMLLSAHRCLLSSTIYDFLISEWISLWGQLEVKPGFYEKTWQANSASGLYFLRIEATSVNDPNNRFLQVKKMLLLK